MPDTVPHFHIALALVWRDSRVLVARRPSDAAHLPDVWEFPGGKCGDGETPRQAAIREAREELGTEVEVTSEHAPISHAYPTRRVTLHPFSCRIVSGEPQPRASDALRWLAPQEMNVQEFPVANKTLIEELQRDSSPR
ncbi:MAG TPA: (deoxy)nucleoside triphosphate pyrophosphohydrolase [Abditibacteriaceae bacterium]|jgi:mutator protein MutT